MCFGLDGFLLRENVFPAALFFFFVSGFLLIDFFYGSCVLSAKTKSRYAEQGFTKPKNQKPV